MASELTTESYIATILTNLTCGKTDVGWTCDPLCRPNGFLVFSC